jgi:hypothetical protein
VTPEQEEQVRRALGAAAHPGAAARPDPPMPPDVVDRLDTVLAELVAPRVAASEPAGQTVNQTTGQPADQTADELAVRRRRRWPNALVAAATVAGITLAGVAIGTGGLGLAGRSGGESTTAGGSTRTPSGDTATEARSRSTGSSPDTSTRRSTGTPTGAATGGAGPAAPRQPRSLAGQDAGTRSLRTPTLAGDVRRLVDRRTAPGPANGALACRRPPVHEGDRLLGVRLDGRLATLVLGPPVGGRQQARVYSCQHPGTPLATTTVRTSVR